MIHLFKMTNEVVLSSSQVDYLEYCLPQNIFLKSQEYIRWQDRQAYLGGRFMLLEGLRKLNLSADVFSEMKYTGYGRPYLPLDIDFNISHSENFILCVISDKYRVGIDIEKIRIIDINDFRNQFTELEFVSIGQAPNKYMEFFRIWTIKEAVIKADGRGMSLDFKSIMIDENGNTDVNGQSWYVKEIDVSPKYIAHLATDFVIEDRIKHDLITIPEF